MIGGSRIPFARADGPYATASNQDMLTAALDGLVERTGLEGERAGEFVAGAVLKHSRDFNLARETVLGSRLDPRTPAYDIQQACGTGLQAVFAAASKIALGAIDCGIAGGADTASDAPLGVNDQLRRILLEARRAKLAGARPARWPGAPPASRPRHPAQRRTAHRPLDGRARGAHRRAWDIGRAAQDELAAASHRSSPPPTTAASSRLVRPTAGWTATRTSAPTRPSRSWPRCGRCSADPSGTMTAGNSTPLTDGAAVVLLASEEWARERGLPRWRT